MSRYHDVARRGPAPARSVATAPLSPLSRPVDSSHYSRGAGRPRTVCAAHAHQPQLHLRLRNSSAARPGRRSCSGCRGWTVARPTRNSVLGCSAAVFWPEFSVKRRLSVRPLLSRLQPPASPRQNQARCVDQNPPWPQFWPLGPAPGAGHNTATTALLPRPPTIPTTNQRKVISAFQHIDTRFLLLLSTVNSPQCVNSRMSAVPRPECGGTRP